MHKVFSAILMFVFLFTFISCSAHATEGAQDIKTIESLSLEDYLADYDQMWTSLYSSYPFFGAFDRMSIDYKYIQQKHRQELIDSGGNIESFLRCMTATMKDLKYFAHLGRYDVEIYHYATEVFDEANSSGMMTEPWGFDITPWLATLRRPQSKYFYSYCQRRFVVDEKSSQEFNPPKVRLFPEVGVGYIRIDAFDYLSVRRDGEIIKKFYKDTVDFKHIIIDITRNPGGSTNFWTENLVAPLGGEYQYTNYTCYKDSNLTRKFYIQAQDHLYLEPFHKFPTKVPFSNPEDKEELRYFTENKNVLSYPTEIHNNARRWVLIDKYVYSASEEFSIFCKETGWATLVGNQTGGDGIGEQPIIVSLENTGLILTFSVCYGIGNDGVCNQSEGTKPDIQCSLDQNPFSTCLKELELLGININDIRID